MNDLITAPDVDKTIAPLDPENPIASMLNAMIANGITSDTASAMQTMTELYWKMESKRAEQEFNRAFAMMQAELPEIVASKAVPGNAPGSIRYVYEPLEKIKRSVKPTLTKYQFGYTMDHEVVDGRVISICTLIHVAGHSRVGRSGRKYGKGPPGTNDAQADGSTDEYADRGAFCAVLGISIQKDNDARGQGDFITAEEAADLEARARAVGANIPMLLKVAEAESFAKIMDSKYDLLNDLLIKKAQSQKAKPAAPMTWDVFHAQMTELSIDKRIAPSSLTKLAVASKKLTPDQFPLLIQAAKSDKLNWDTGEVLP